MYTGIEFNGKHSRDFNLTISEREIGYPSKIKRTERVPFSNEIYDFSNIYLGQEYEERNIRYTFNIVNRDKLGDFKSEYTDFNFYETEVANWLMGTVSKEVLKDDTLPGYYFLAEIEDSPANEFRIIGGELTVTFKAYPFKISEAEEGNDIWDDFNFLLDVAQ